MTAIPAAKSQWFLSTRPAPQAPIRLFCLPPAGGGASTFRQWPAALGDQIDVRALALPGREARIAEPPRIEIAAIADAIGADIDRPYAIFGHSMGGRIGFEVLRELRRRGIDMPLALILAANRAPHLVDSHLGGISERSDPELVDRLVTLGGIPADVAAEPELLELLLPMLRADFSWLDAYRFMPDEPLPVPVIGFAGANDAAVSIMDMVGWTRHTIAGVYLDTLPGGHFFPTERLPHLADAIRTRLRGVMSGRGPTHLASTLDQPGPDELHVYYAERDDRRAVRDASTTSELLRRLLGRYGLDLTLAADDPATSMVDGSAQYQIGSIRVGFSQVGGASLVALACGDRLSVSLPRADRADGHGDSAPSGGGHTQAPAGGPPVLRLDLPIGTGAVTLAGPPRRMRFVTLGAGDLD